MSPGLVIKPESIYSRVHFKLPVVSESALPILDGLDAIFFSSLLSAHEDFLYLCYISPFNNTLKMTVSIVLK